MVNWGGALAGGASGAAAGSMFGPIGTALGDIGGALFGSADKNRQPKIKNQNILHPLQQQGLESYFGNPINRNPLYQQGSDYLQNLLSGSPEAFNQFADPMQQHFEQYTTPAIAERFAGMGTGGGASSSSALFNSLAQAGRGLSADLGQIRGNMQMGAAGQGLGYAQQPYSNLMAGLGVQANQPYERPGQPSFLTNASSGLFSGMGSGVSQAFGQKAGEGIYNRFFPQNR